jgi:hypothetical protein
VLAIAIAEFWLSADAAARFSASVTSVDGDALTILGIPVPIFGRMLYCTYLPFFGRGGRTLWLFLPPHWRSASAMPLPI